MKAGTYSMDKGITSPGHLTRFLAAIIFSLISPAFLWGDWKTTPGPPHSQNVLIIYVSDDSFGNQVIRTHTSLQDVLDGASGSGLAFNVTVLPVCQRTRMGSPMNWPPRD
jgi:hypothetical protein